MEKNISFRDLLKNEGIKPSYQRIKILEFIDFYYTHPTADEIYQALVPEIPTLSKTTVYNTVKLFVDKGLVQQIYLDDGNYRYDINKEMHGHFVCLYCASIIDIAVDYNLFDYSELDGYVIEKKSLILKGICKDCQTKQGREQ